MQQNKVDLAAFDGSEFDKGAGFLKTALWYVINALLVRASWNPFGGGQSVFTAYVWSKNW